MEEGHPLRRPVNARPRAASEPHEQANALEAALLAAERVTDLSHFRGNDTVSARRPRATQLQEQRSTGVLNYRYTNHSRSALKDFKYLVRRATYDDSLVNYVLPGDNQTLTLERVVASFNWTNGFGIIAVNVDSLMPLMDKKDMAAMVRSELNCAE